MLYCDTSFLAPLLLDEPSSGKIERFFARQRPGVMAVSQWTLVEFASVLAREVRMGGLTAAQARETDDEFHRLTSASFVILPAGPEDFLMARRFVRNYETGLRAGDALHLAIASNYGAQMIYSLDKGFINAARRLKLPASFGIRL